MSFDCRYKGRDNQCIKLKKECSPGCKGCVLYGKFYIPFKEDDKKTSVNNDDKTDS